mmetsp:Transcript_17004/g.35691  ORF Transcript_17004/g.35691 Transcript_17004/m.35691 type:complete len:275 (-) Transcript_17004:515-1339(-)
MSIRAEIDIVVHFCHCQRREEDVARLDITMNDTTRMKEGQPRQNFGEGMSNFMFGQQRGFQIPLRFLGRHRDFVMTTFVSDHFEVGREIPAGAIFHNQCVLQRRRCVCRGHGLEEFLVELERIVKLDNVGMLWMLVWMLFMMLLLTAKTCRRQRFVNVNFALNHFQDGLFPPSGIVSHFFLPSGVSCISFEMDEFHRHFHIGWAFPREVDGGEASRSEPDSQFVGFGIFFFAVGKDDGGDDSSGFSFVWREISATTSIGVYIFIVSVAALKSAR